MKDLSYIFNKHRVKYTHFIYIYVERERERESWNTLFANQHDIIYVAF